MIGLSAAIGARRIRHAAAHAIHADRVRPTGRHQRLSNPEAIGARWAPDRIVCA
jgi:hypothetical protein